MDNNTILSQIGNTPLVRLKQASELTGCNIYGKAEYYNPGESVKDRAALFIVKDAIEKKLITKGGTIVEGTAGNTGIGLAVVCKEYGLKLKIVIPKTQSKEKKDTLKDYGAELIEVEAVPYSNSKNYIKQSKEIAKNLMSKSSNGVYWANQFDNVINTEAHIKTTAQEIWSQTAGKIDAFTCAVGTGGTLSGVSIGLKEKNKNIKIIGVQPEEGAQIPGIRKWPKEYLPSIFSDDNIDEIVNVSQKNAEETARKLAKNEGIFSGASTGGALFVALQIAKQNHNSHIVSIACDRGDRYLSTGIFPK